MVHNEKNARDVLSHQIEKLKALLKGELEKPKMKAVQEKAKARLTLEEQQIVKEKAHKIAEILKASVERKKMEIETTEFMAKTKAASSSTGLKVKKSFRTGRI